MKKAASFLLWFLLFTPAVSAVDPGASSKDDGKGWRTEVLPNSGDSTLRFGDKWRVTVPSGGVSGRLVAIALPDDELAGTIEDEETGESIFIYKTGLDLIIQIPKLGIFADDESPCEGKIKRGEEIVSVSTLPRCGFSCPSFPARETGHYYPFPEGSYSFEVGDSGGSSLSNDPHPWCDAGGAYAIRFELEGGGYLPLRLIKDDILLPYRPFSSSSSASPAWLRQLQEESRQYQYKKDHGLLPGQRKSGERR